jgi:hypothetical protein
MAANDMKEINHMDLVTRRDLEALLDDREEGPCVSIFLPTHRVGPDSQQDPIRLKNLLGEAEGQLVERGVRAAEARELLEPARKLLDDHHFWRYQNDGLAIFISPKRFLSYRLPIEVEDLVVVADRFHVKPLLSLLTGDGQFYLLAISQGSVRLLQGTRYTVSQTELENIPESLAEALRYDDFERGLQFRTGSGPRYGGRRRAIFHGHGMGEEEAKENVLRFFRQLDHGLNELLRSEQVPLVLAGVEYLLPLYREANSYPRLAEEAVKGNPEELSAKQLHEQSWQVVEPLFHQAEEEAVSAFHRLSGTGKASGDLEEVLPAAQHGRVDSLFVPVGVQRWGHFESQNNGLVFHEEMRPGDEDLLDLAATHTLLNGGSVYAVRPEAVPGGGTLAAVFRY